MKPHEERVVVELNELADRTRLLDEFIKTSSIFPTLPKDERQRLELQLHHMTQYASVLAERIDNFPKEVDV